MENKEQNILKFSEYSDHDRRVFTSVVEDYSTQDVGEILRDKGELLKLLEQAHVLREKKERQIEEAKKHNVSDEDMQVLEIELQQKNLVVKDREIHLRAINTVLDIKSREKGATESPSVGGNPEHVADDSKKEKDAFHGVREYVSAHAHVLVAAKDMPDYLSGMLKPGTATLGYYDAENVKFDVSGYNLVFVNDAGDLMRAKIIPEEMYALKKANQLHEREELENELEKSEFTIDDSEQFLDAIGKLLVR